MVKATTSTGSLPMAAIVLFGALGYGFYRQGAYHDTVHGQFALLVVAAGIALCLTVGGRDAARQALLVVSPLLIASVISTVAGSERGDARSTFLTIALVAIALACGLSVEKPSATLAIDLFVVLAAVVSATAIWGVATHSAPWGRITGEMWRGSSSITYANGAAGVIAPALILGFWRAEAAGARVYAAASVLLAIGLVSTQSRGGTLALALAACVLALHLGLTRTVRTAVPLAGGTAIGSALLLGRASTAQEPQAGLVLALVAFAIVVTIALWPLRDRITRPAPVAGGALVAIVLAVVLTPLGERFTLRSATTATGSEGDVLFGDRAKEWSTAWDLVLDRPILGHGPGNVDLRWVENGRSFMALFVHNEYLELLVTHGLLGALALVAAGFVAWRVLSPTRAQTPVLIAVAAFLVHSSLDYLWHIPALPVAMAFVLGLARGVAGFRSELDANRLAHHAVIGPLT